MKAVVDKKHDKVVIAAECGADEGRRHVEKVELRTHDAETVKHVERKMADKGVGRLDRHPADGLPLKHQPKKGHGGKYTWEGPHKEFEAEAEAAVDDKDPNYIEDDGMVVGEVETPKVAPEGVARLEVDPSLQT
ncbi:uncharacterized protein LOC130997915 [Salvia miltiorrhiza]|uniref:uncharacterized protein LOC130997915 n=1 Tax=Salvia miltiorrhiza TaxID=226208 RepID=UPI0025AD4210|nr:uncharacterized protein LOC130997915 [Salvia miltiorrhiza]